MSDKNTQVQAPNLAEMSDDEISNLDYTTLGKDETESSPPEAGKSAADAAPPDNDNGDPGGADSGDDSGGAAASSAGSTSTDDDRPAGNVPYTPEIPTQTATSHQDVVTDVVETGTEKKQPVELDPKAELAKVFAPFKAAKRTIQVNTVDDVRQLMQKGVDYARKMESMKPYMRILKTLESNGLLDETKVNFLIDLDKKNPEAVKKFLKDSEIDPMNLDLEDDTKAYKPTNHMVGDKEMALNEVLDEIRETPVFARTVDIITKQWDGPSRQVLMDEPQSIRFLNEQVQNGIYDQIMDVVENERMLGRIPAGLSTLDAYKAVGDAMHKAKAFKAPSANSKTDQGFSQDSGSKSSQDDNDIKNRKRAASPTKGTAGAGKVKVDLSKLTDAQIEALDYATL